MENPAQSALVLQRQAWLDHEIHCVLPKLYTIQSLLRDMSGSVFSLDEESQEVFQLCRDIANIGLSNEVQVSENVYTCPVSLVLFGLTVICL